MDTTAPVTSAALPSRTGDALAGVLIGTAAGDALGLPMEGLTARRQQRLFPGPLKHRLIGRWGMTSDDTEHTMMLAQALLDSPGDSVAFQRSLARRFRWWLISLPAGVGFATLRAILKLWVGVHPGRAGVMSAGNGPAMRCALLGVYFFDQPAVRREYIRASTLITHRDPRAETAAQAVAEAAAWMSAPAGDTGELLQALQDLDRLQEWQTIMEAMRAGLQSQLPVAEFAKQIGAVDGVSGFAFQSVPVAIYAAVRHLDDFSSALTEAIRCGGDSDTVGAITGALAGARIGVGGIPTGWREGIAEYPRSLRLLHEIAMRLALQRDGGPAKGPADYFWPAIPLRNLAFLGVVLTHGFRRLLPPY